METLLAEIKQWMSTDMLKLNDSKTEIMAVGGPWCNMMELQSLTVGNEEVDVTKCVRLPGVDSDSDLTSKQHVWNVANKCFYMLKNIFKIRFCINETAAKAGVHSMITSKLDYCNAILYGLQESTLKHFTRVQNLSACFISQHGEYEHITQVLKQLHWLPVYQRICYKVVKWSGTNLPWGAYEEETYEKNKGWWQQWLGDRRHQAQVLWRKISGLWGT